MGARVIVSRVHELTSIVFDILLPILVLVFLGVWMRLQFEIDLGTLGKLNLFLLVPAFVYEKVATSGLELTEMAGVVIISILHVVMLGLLTWGIGRVLRIDRKTLAALMIAVMFFNSGNYGLSLAQLVYGGTDRGASAGAVQAFVVLVQNVLTFTLGLWIAASAGSAHWTEIFTKMLRMPVIYTLAAAILTLWLTGGDGSRIPRFIHVPAQFLSNGLVPVAMVTMGAQLASNPRWPKWKPLSLVLFMRLIVGPALMVVTLWLLHLLGWKVLDVWPWPAEMLILTAAVPTAVNTLLMTLELEGDAELAADCVFWTTVFSTFTLAGWLWIVKSGWIAAG